MQVKAAFNPASLEISTDEIGFTWLMSIIDQFILTLIWNPIHFLHKSNVVPNKSFVYDDVTM